MLKVVDGGGGFKLEDAELADVDGGLARAITTLVSPMIRQDRFLADLPVEAM